MVDPRVNRLRRLKCGVITAARLITQGLQKGGFRFRAVMITCTYAPEVAWEPRHITGLLNAARAHLARRGHVLRYVWVLELTKKGRPHYHLLLSLPRGVPSLPKPDKRGWWPHGMTRIEWARNAVGYLAKYASKGVEHEAAIPKGARLYGVGGFVTPECRREAAWWRCPKFVRERFPLPEPHRPRRAKGGGWISRLTGELLRSAWAFGGLVGGLVRMIKRPHDLKAGLGKVDQDMYVAEARERWFYEGKDAVARWSLEMPRGIRLAEIGAWGEA